MSFVILLTRIGRQGRKRRVGITGWEIWKSTRVGWEKHARVKLFADSTSGSRRQATRAGQDHAMGRLARQWPELSARYGRAYVRVCSTAFIVTTVAVWVDCVYTRCLCPYSRICECSDAPTGLYRCDRAPGTSSSLSYNTAFTVK